MEAYAKRMKCFYVCSTVIQFSIFLLGFNFLNIVLFILFHLLAMAWAVIFIVFQNKDHFRKDYQYLKKSCPKLYKKWFWVGTKNITGYLILKISKSKELRLLSKSDKCLARIQLEHQQLKEISDFAFICMVIQMLLCGIGS